MTHHVTSARIDRDYTGEAAVDLRLVRSYGSASAMPSIGPDQIPADLAAALRSWLGTTPTVADVPDGLSYADLIAQKTARAVCDEFDRRITVTVGAHTAEQAADGLDDHDGPVVRARPYIEIGRLSELTVWARHGDRWWYAGVTEFTDTGAEVDWLHGMPRHPDEFFRLPGWVEIPTRQTADTPAEEPTDG
ncbi:hypothetical protein AB1484_27245 [Parafrankia sp. FMc6]|uniref:hypothetical protein n=1 Tax=Parafrankia soli TaxID=2599596 RepID=UPI0034D3E053